MLLPSATVFLFLLCNDSAVLGPWVNSRGLNLFTGVVIGLLVTLSVILTAAVLFPDLTGTRITELLVVGVTGSVLAAWSRQPVGKPPRRHSWPPKKRPLANATAGAAAAAEAHGA